MKRLQSYWNGLMPDTRAGVLLSCLLALFLISGIVDHRPGLALLLALFALPPVVLEYRRLVSEDER